ncbi:hypothetical protein ACTMU2_21055 [Cupriavidus basilensis]
MSERIVLAIARAKSGYEAALVKAQSLVAIVRQWPGCIRDELNTRSV